MGFSCLLNAGNWATEAMVLNAGSIADSSSALPFSFSRNCRLKGCNQPRYKRFWASSSAENVQEAPPSYAEDARDSSGNIRIERHRMSQGRARVFKFYQPGGSQVKFSVAREDGSYNVSAAIISMEEDKLYMHWNIFRSNSSNWGEIVLDKLPAGTTRVNGSFQTSLQKAGSVHTLQFELSSSYAPFFVGFRILQNAGMPQDISTREAIGVPQFVFPVGCGRGSPEPLGNTVCREGELNFALYSKHATAAILCLYRVGSTQPSVELELQPSINKTGNIWHIELDDVGMFDRYGYRCKGESTWEQGNRFHARRILLDPYSNYVAPFLSGQDSLPSPAAALGILGKEEGSQFDWEDDVHPDIPLEEMVAYRLNVTDFTADKSSGLQENLLGTFDGLRDKIQHLKSMGVNSIILQPVFFCQDKKELFGPLSFFAPMDCFGPMKTSVSSSLSLKKAVKELHSSEIEVLLDVVFTHTGENNDDAPQTISFRGIDNATYYILDQNGRVSGSDTGANNCFNCNHPVVQTMILDSLRHWVVEYHIDGFLFVNASSLTKGPHGEELSRPLLVEALAFDPVLSKSKLFADTSSPFTRTRKDITFPHWRRWCLWNNKYKEDVRQFLRGDKGKLSNFATRLCGSGDLLVDRPSLSLNHVTSPYGLTLVDLVSYSTNIEGDSEQSWNCGEEGRTSNQVVLNIRVKQVRNFLMCLFLSQGIPILNMGDEYGLSKGGSLSLGQRKPFNWDSLKLDFGKQTSHLIASLAAFRSRRKDLFQRKDFVKLENIQWHGVELNEPDWESADGSFIAVSLISEKKSNLEPFSELGDIYIGFNAGNAPVVVCLPEPCPGMNWHRIADTSLPYPQNFQEAGVLLTFPEDESTTTPSRSYRVQSYSSFVLEARTVV